MGVTKKCNAVWLKLNNFLDCFLDGGACLIGQSIDQINIYGLNAAIPKSIDDAFCLFKRLLAIDRSLNTFIKVLNTDADARHAG